MGRLDNQVAVVTGATRGGGRGIALALGAEGAVVYVTGRSTRGNPTVIDTPRGIEDVAEEVSARGGTGIAVRCDHTQDADVQALFETVRAGHDGIDVLVCNAWGGYMPYEQEMAWFAQPFWQQSMARWDGMFTAGLRSHVATCLFALPGMLAQGRRGLIVLTTFTMGSRYLGHLFYDVAKNAVCRMAAGLGTELRDTDISVVALAPGWMLCERMTGLTDAERAQTESVEYVGRAVAALAADPGVGRRSGRTLTAGDLAREYGFTDIDGRQPIAYPIDH
jgi:NAD(P)-dependent dehydrogenase (short-subunit alcohol dehydrogenase family)